MSIAYRGTWPVVPTPFRDDGSLDPEGQKRVLDCMIDQGVDGMCILANYSEQFLLSDEEREQLLALCLEHVAERVPVIVTCSHFSTHIAVQRARSAAAHGAAMIMLMPPYHGATLQADEMGTYEQFARVGEACGLPIMVQDAPLSGVNLSTAFLLRLAHDIEQVSYFKIETAQAAAKLRALVEAGGDAIVGPFDGEESITLMADLNAGATGTMSSALLPDRIKPVVEHHFSGRIAEAANDYARILPLINFENRQCGLRACKCVMKEGGVIDSEAVRHPIPALHPATRGQLMELARGHDLVALRWGH